MKTIYPRTLIRNQADGVIRYIGIDLPFLVLPPLMKGPNVIMTFLDVSAGLPRRTPETTGQAQTNREAATGCYYVRELTYKFS